MRDIEVATIVVAEDDETLVSFILGTLDFDLGMGLMVKVLISAMEKSGRRRQSQTLEPLVILGRDRKVIVMARDRKINS